MGGRWHRLQVSLGLSCPHLCSIVVSTTITSLLTAHPTNSPCLRSQVWCFFAAHMFTRAGRNGTDKSIPCPDPPTGFLQAGEELNITKKSFSRNRIVTINYADFGYVCTWFVSGIVTIFWFSIASQAHPGLLFLLDFFPSRIRTKCERGKMLHIFCVKKDWGIPSRVDL